MEANFSNLEFFNLYSKMQILPPEKWVEVKDFVDFLLTRESKIESNLLINKLERFPLTGTKIIYDCPFDSVFQN